MEKQLQRLHDYGPSLFLLVMLFLSMFGPLIADQLPAPSDIDPGHASKLGRTALVVTAMLIAPALETLIYQFLPALLAQRVHIEGLARLLLVTIPFSSMHFMNDAPLPSIANGFGGGLILALCYIICMRRSHAYAVGMTATLHSLHNAAIFILYQ